MLLKTYLKNILHSVDIFKLSDLDNVMIALIYKNKPVEINLFHLFMFCGQTYVMCGEVNRFVCKMHHTETSTNQHMYIEKIPQ